MVLCNNNKHTVGWFQFGALNTAQTNNKYQYIYIKQFLCRPLIPIYSNNFFFKHCFVVELYNVTTIYLAKCKLDRVGLLLAEHIF